MHYISTRGQAPEASFEEVLLTGLAPDGGLYLPAEIPTLDAPAIAALAPRSYEEAAFTVMRPFIGDTFTDEEFRGLIDDAYSRFDHLERAPLISIGPEDRNDWILELHHGPTLAFKDFAMQLMGRMLEAVLKRQGRRITVIAATSGDTGSAALEAFRDREGITCIVLYPHERVSDVQRRQMTTVEAGNVHALAVKSDFDFCQAVVKEMFADEAFRDEVGLAAANSINWARIMAQIVYYFTAAVRLGAPGREIDFCVPTGNFGNVYAGHVARRMGLPIRRLIVATNANDILHRTIEKGDHSRFMAVPTIAPSMDIQIASNFERLLYELYGEDASKVHQSMEYLKDKGFALSADELKRLRAGFASSRAENWDIEPAIKRVAERDGILIDPHTAAGIVAEEANRQDNTPTVILGTAHAAKFPDAVEEACGKRPDPPPQMAGLDDRPERVTVLPGDYRKVRDAVRERAA